MRLAVIVYLVKHWRGFALFHGLEDSPGVGQLRGGYRVNRVSSQLVHSLLEEDGYF